MEKNVHYDDLRLEEEVGTTIVKINGKDIKVLSYLPIDKKSQLINITLQESINSDTKMLDKMKVEANFNIGLIVLYTDLSLNTNNTYGMYDLLERNNVIDTIVQAIPEDEYNTLTTFLEEAIEDYDKYKISIPGMINDFMTNIPKVVQSLTETLDGLDLDKFENVTELAKSLGLKD